MTLDEYQQKALSTALKSSDSIMYRVLGLSGEAGEIAQALKKWIRDDDSDPSKLNKNAIASELGDAMWYVATLAHSLGFTLEEIAQDNVDKLANRKKRGSIGGSGEER